MSIPTILAMAVLGGVVAIALHWRRRQGEPFLHHSDAGWPRILFVACVAATAAGAVLFLARWVPAATFLGVACGVTIAQELYSIVRRQQQRAA